MKSCIRMTHGIFICRSLFVSAERMIDYKAEVLLAGLVREKNTETNRLLASLSCGGGATAAAANWMVGWNGR